MAKRTNILAIGAVCLILGLTLCAGSCKSQAAAVNTSIAVPNIPPSYYACIQANIDDLLKQYFFRYGNFYQAEQAYDGQIFLFRGVQVNPAMIVDKNTFTLSTAEFIALQPGAVGQLKVGEIIDIVGVDQGPMPTIEGTPITAFFNPDGSPALEGGVVPGWLQFSGCVFLPTGSVQLPAPGAPAFAPLY